MNRPKFSRHSWAGFRAATQACLVTALRFVRASEAVDGAGTIECSDLWPEFSSQNRHRTFRETSGGLSLFAEMKFPDRLRQFPCSRRWRFRANPMNYHHFLVVSSADTHRISAYSLLFSLFAGKTGARPVSCGLRPAPATLMRTDDFPVLVEKAGEFRGFGKCPSHRETLQ